jgi:hypothetical protein
MSGHGCVHEVDSSTCCTLELRALRIREEDTPGRQNGSVRASGEFAVPPDVTGTPPITLHLTDGGGLDVTHTFDDCRRPRTRPGALCGDPRTGRIAIQTRTGGLFRVKFVLPALAIERPFTPPVNVTLEHDGAQRNDVLVDCSQTVNGLRCHRPRPRRRRRPEV